MKKLCLLLLILISLSSNSFSMFQPVTETLLTRHQRARLAYSRTSHSSTKKFLVVANGEWDERLVKKYIPDRKIIALDGAAYNFYESSIFPHFILGDFDSLLEKFQKNGKNYFNLTSALKHFDDSALSTDEQGVKFEIYTPPLINVEDMPITYIKAHFQDYADLTKGIGFCLTQRENDEPIDITIACALGGDRLDHFFGNFTVLKKYASSLPEYRDVSVKIVNKLQIVQFLSAGEKMIFTGNIGDKCGFFGFPSASIKSKGLKWELNDYPLAIGISESSCNELRDARVEIEIEKGEALIIRPNIDFNKM